MAPIASRHRPQRPFRLAGQSWMRPLRLKQAPGGNSPSPASARQSACGRTLCRFARGGSGQTRKWAVSPVFLAQFNTGCRLSHGLFDEPEFPRSRNQSPACPMTRAGTRDGTKFQTWRTPGRDRGTETATRQVLTSRRGARRACGMPAIEREPIRDRCAKPTKCRILACRTHGEATYAQFHVPVSAVGKRIASRFPSRK